MATGTFLAQYFVPDPLRPERRKCRVEAFRDQIVADGGRYAYRECLGDQACVVVANVTAATLTAIVNDPVIRRFPGVNQPGDNLGQLSAAQWTGYRDFAVTLGYPAAEWDAAFPLDKSTYTLRDVLVFMVKRRLTPRFDDGATNTVILDGAVVNQPASIVDELAASAGV